jgi:hypothetical protein
MGIKSIKITDSETANLNKQEMDAESVQQLRKTFSYAPQQKTFEMKGQMDSGSEFSGIGKLDKNSITIQQVIFEGKAYKVEPEYSVKINDKREIENDNDKNNLGNLLERKSIKIGRIFKDTIKLEEIPAPKKTSALSTDEAMQVAIAQAAAPATGFKSGHNATPATQKSDNGAYIG